MKSQTVSKFILSLSLVIFNSLSFAQSQVQSTPISLEELKSKIIKPQFQNERFDTEEILNSRYISWGVAPDNKNSSINVVEAWRKFEGRKEIVVAVIDTGIDPTHPFLKDNLYTIDGKAGIDNYGIDFSKSAKNRKQPVDTHGHGTHVSGIIKSVFPKVKILPLKYYDKSASGKDNLDSTIAALKYAVDNNVDVINYSGGGPEADYAELEILKKAEAKGILVIAAAGNEESNIDNKKNAYFPASYKLSNIITVTAYNESLQILSSSNYGKESVDVAAPGYQIKSSLNLGRAGFLTGTSQATAFVSGVVAMIKSQYPNTTPEQMKNIIISSAKKEFSFTGKCKSEGRVDAAKALEFANQLNKNNSDSKFAKSKKSTKANRNLANTKKKEGKIIFRISK